MSAEAPVEGTSAECTEMTSVILESALHKTQNLLQNSLPLTPRPLIDGKPCKCKQEAAESVVMAGHANGTVETAEPTEITDINGMALLGREPAERARGIGEGDETECEAQSRLQESKLLCGEKDQHSRNATENIPIAYGLPLKGEWSVYPSSESSKLKGCSGGMDECASIDEAAAECCQQLGMADVHPGCGAEPVEMPNEPEMLVTVSTQLEGPDSSDISRVYLGGSRMRMGDANGPASQADASNGLTDGIESHMDMLNRSTDVPSVENHTRTARNEMQNVRTPRFDSKTQNSPIGPENGTLKHSTRWRKVSRGDVDVYVPWDAPVEVPSRRFVFGWLEKAGEAIAPSVESRDEAIVPNVEMAEDGNGNRSGDGDDGDGTASSGNVNSMRVSSVQLAGETRQHERPNAESKRKVPVSSRPST